MYKGLKSKFLKISISRRILLFFSSLILVSLLLTGLLFQRVYYKVMMDQVQESSMQTAISISTNIETILGRINSYSRILLSNKDVQDLLTSEDGYSEIALRESVAESLFQMTINFKEISSIYLIDRNKRRYFTETKAVDSFDFNDYFFAGAWSKARRLAGSAYFALDGDAIFVNRSSEKFISNIRVVNSIYTQKPIGGIVINMPEKVLKELFNEISKEYDTEIFLVNESLRVITFTDKMDSQTRAFMKSGENSYIDRDGNSIYSRKILDNDWQVITVAPINGGGSFTTFLLTTLIALVSLSIMVFWGSMIITKMITKPVNILADSMTDLGRGNLRKVEFHTSVQEFNSLRDGYNKLTDEIESLISKVINQEKIKRKAELNTLQAQIKPHFLYNTFDSIASLALMGDNQQVYNMVTSLGNFYRISLSKGREVITLGEELDALKSYLKILNIRYDNFRVNFNLDEKLYGTNILKLILQPFVENAIYHGIKPKGECGNISITTKRFEEYTLISIEDDGVGMNEEAIDSIFTGSSSFGVKGTLERINLFYNKRDLVAISSKRGVGTRVDIKIPVVREVVHG